MNTSSIYLFLKYCLSASPEVPIYANDIDWSVLLDWAKRQAIVGICFDGIKRLNAENGTIPHDVLMKWIGYSHQIEMRNQHMNDKSAQVIHEYQKEGFDCVLLKGQGNATFYPNPASRTPGDIDILLRNVSFEKISSYIKREHSIRDIRLHHVEYNDDGDDVEIHFIPCLMNNPFFHKRLLRWLDKEWDNRTNVELIGRSLAYIPVPSWEYNVVFQLAHLMHHFFDEGIGLRQFIDYYYLLRTAEIRRDYHYWTETLSGLGLFSFAKAVMYLEKEILGLDECFLIVPADERRGKTLMAEIEKGGNFGKYSGLAKQSKGRKFFSKTWRNLRLVDEYPQEALFEPFFRIGQFIWRSFYISK